MIFTAKTIPSQPKHDELSKFFIVNDRGELIGELSSDAKWVKDGTTFEISQMLVFWQNKSMKTSSGGRKSSSIRPYTFNAKPRSGVSYEDWYVKVKVKCGQCGMYH